MSCMFSRRVENLHTRFAWILVGLYLGIFSCAQTSIAQTATKISVQKIAPINFEDWIPVIEHRRADKDNPYFPQFDRGRDFNGIVRIRDGQQTSFTNGSFSLRQADRISTVNATAHLSLEPWWDVVVMPGADLEISEAGIVVHKGHIIVRGTRNTADNEQEPTISIRSGDGRASIDANQYELFSFAHFDWNGAFCSINRAYMGKGTRRSAMVRHYDDPIELKSMDTYRIGQRIIYPNTGGDPFVNHGYFLWQEYPAFASSVLPPQRLIAPSYGYISSDNLIFAYLADDMTAILEASGFTVSRGKGSLVDSTRSWLIDRVSNFSTFRTSNRVEILPARAAALVPPLKDMALDVAISRLEALGLKTKVVWTRRSGDQKTRKKDREFIGEVWRDGGGFFNLNNHHLVPAGTTLNLGTFLPYGIHPILPNLVGMTVEQADRLLAQIGASSIKVEKRLRPGVQNRVVSKQVPAAGQRQRRHSVEPIILWEDTPAADMPDLVGLHIRQAQEQLDRLGVRYKISECESCATNPATPAGHVVSTYPTGLIELGGTVSIQIASALPNPAIHPPSTPVSPPPASTVSAADMSGYWYYKNRAHPPEQRIEIAELGGQFWWSGRGRMIQLTKAGPNVFRTTGPERLVFKNGEILWGDEQILTKVQGAAWAPGPVRELRPNGPTVLSDFNVDMSWIWRAGTQYGWVEFDVFRRDKWINTKRYDVSTFSNRGVLPRIEEIESNTHLQLRWRVVSLMQDGSEYATNYQHLIILSHPRYYNSTKAEVDAIDADTPTAVLVNGNDWRTLAKRLTGGLEEHTCWVHLNDKNDREGCVVLRYRNALIGVVSPARHGNKAVDRLMALRDDGEAYFMQLEEKDLMIPTHIAVRNNDVVFMGVRQNSIIRHAVSLDELRWLIDNQGEFLQFIKPS